jgi:hypothetical protein
MRIFPLAALAAITLGTTLAGSTPARAQAAATSPQPKRIFGYQDAHTGVFHPVRRVAPDTTITPTTGKYEITYSITVESTFPKGATITCAATISETTISESGTGGVAEHTEQASASVPAPAAGGKTTCTVVIPYSWVIPASTKTAPVVSEVGGEYTVTAYNPPSTTVSEASVEGLRTSESELPIPATVPASAAVTSVTVDVTI